MKTFELAIVSAAKAYPARTVTALEIPACDGWMSVLAGHEPHVTELGAGEARFTLEDGQVETLEITRGMLTVTPERATILLS